MQVLPLLRGLETAGPFQVLEALGPVPFGTAYRAVDSRTGREVLVKEIPPSLRSRGFGVPWEILLHETETLARIYHRGLPALVEVAEHDEALLVAWEPPGGRSLRELLAAGRRPDRARVLRWGGELLEALAEAHARGVLHRHLGEDEVVLGAEGHLVVTGFGLTPLVFDPATTPAPEQLAGGAATPETDLYAAGALLERLLSSGPIPGPGKPPACASTARGGAARDPLLRVLARATAPSPSARHASAAEMAEALAAVAA